jgi:hypothetical protein
MVDPKPIAHSSRLHANGPTRTVIRSRHEPGKREFLAEIWRLDRVSVLSYPRDVYDIEQALKYFGNMLGIARIMETLPVLAYPTSNDTGSRAKSAENSGSGSRCNDRLARPVAKFHQPSNQPL